MAIRFLKTEGKRFMPKFYMAYLFRTDYQDINYHHTGRLAKQNNYTWGLPNQFLLLSRMTTNIYKIINHHAGTFFIKKHDCVWPTQGGASH